MTLRLLFVAGLCQLAACSEAPQEAPSGAPAAVAETPAAPADAPAPASVYRCDSGDTITATYNGTESATLQYQGASHHLQIAVSGSGSRYVGDGLEWWIKGSAGTLSRLQADGAAGDSIASCQES